MEQVFGTNGNVCDISGHDRGTWQGALDIANPCLWVQWIPNELVAWAPCCFALDDFFGFSKATIFISEDPQRFGIQDCDRTIIGRQPSVLGKPLQGGIDLTA